MSDHSKHETHTDYGRVLAITSDGEMRVILSSDSPPAVQWIIQRRKTATKWVSMKFCQSKVGMRIFAPHELSDFVEALPDWCPQIRHESGSGARSRKKGTGVADTSDLAPRTQDSHHSVGQ